VGGAKDQRDARCGAGRARRRSPQRLKIHHPSKIELPVTCEAPKGSCTAIATVRAKGFEIADGRRKAPSGRTKTLVLVLNG
jgi:hypothetical protein